MPRYLRIPGHHDRVVRAFFSDPTQEYGDDRNVRAPDKIKWRMSSIMKHSARIVVLSTMFMGLLVSAADDPAVARDEHRHRGKLVGLWEGVDALDGSTVLISIGDIDGDEVLDFRWHESFFTGCFNQDNQRGRGVVAGTVDWKNATEFDLLATEFVCFDDSNNRIDRDQITVEFSYSWKDDFLIRIGTDEFPGFILHRTSSVGEVSGRMRGDARRGRDGD